MNREDQKGTENGEEKHGRYFFHPSTGGMEQRGLYEKLLKRGENRGISF
jgi:hypothetical protein